MNMLDVAGKYIAAGVSVIPVRADGSKAPLISGWRSYSNKMADDATLNEWFGGGKIVGLGIVPGPASGNLVILDFEHDGNGSAYVEWLQTLPEELRALVLTLPTVSTPSGGRHVYIRLSQPQPGCKLARYAGGKTKIEIRGEGHQVLAPGCPAECHRSGKLYEWEIPGEIVELDEDTWFSLVGYGGKCNEYLSVDQPRDRDTHGVPAGEDSPGNDFNLRGTWEEAGLFDAGWTWARELDGGRGFLTRPGKSDGISASVGMVSSKSAGYPYFYAWTTSTDFSSETPYSRFAVYAQLVHKGDFSAAARTLKEKGYGGSVRVKPGQVDLSEFLMGNANPFKGIPPIADDKPFQSPSKWLSQCCADDDDVKWIWKGYLRRGGITMFSALWKIGKSTMLSNLLKALDGSATEFVGQAVTPARVMYVTEEDEKIWATRRDELLIGDHVAMCVRPFTSRPKADEWKKLLEDIAVDVEKHRFDLVIFDTLSKMWPVDDENSASEVEKALMPLWKITKDGAGAGVLLVHHTRKSGGDEFVGARGSGGLPAFCEILMEFKRDSADAKETKRIITAVGRYSDIPTKRLCDWQNGKYEGMGDPDDRVIDGKPKEAAAKAKPEWHTHVMAILLEAGTNLLTAEDIAGLLAGRSDHAVRKSELVTKLLNPMFECGKLQRSGEGKNGCPYTYRLNGRND
jgi:hypothetical protein